MTLFVDGKSILVTGGNIGIGYEIARALSKAGARVTLTSRSAARAEDAARRIAAETGREVIGRELDLGAFANINAFADDIVKAGAPLDVLVNNAGALIGTRQQSADGYEMTWAANHLGPYLLTARLMPALKQAPAARVVTTASSAHWSGTIDFDGLGLPRSYSRTGAYGRSKLANILFTPRPVAPAGRHRHDGDLLPSRRRRHRFLPVHSVHWASGAYYRVAIPAFARQGC